MPADPIFQLDKLVVRGSGRDRLRLESLRIPPGVCAVIGPSGAGKTTLLDVLVGFEHGYSGTRGFHPPSGPGLPIFWSPAQGGFWPHLTVRQHLEAVRRDEAAPVEGWLDRLGLADLASALPATLSQGQRSRLGVARALASQARVLVLDEPFVHVDRARIDQDWDVLMEEVGRRQTTLVFSTHDPQRVLANAEHVLALADGVPIYEGAVGPLYRDPPDELSATILGPCTWIPDDERERWCAGVLPRCTRPEQLRLQASDDGPLRVMESVRQGPISRSRLSHEDHGLLRHFWHITSDAVRVGSRVGMQVCALLLLLLASACGPGAEQALPMKAVRHRHLPPLGTRLLAPRALIMLDAARLLVLDNGGRVLIVGRDGEVQARWMMPEYAIGRPEGACLLRDGRIAVADTHYSRVVFFDQEGTVLSILGSHGAGPGQFIYPIKVAQDPAGNLYVAEYGSNDRVQKFNEAGDFVLSFGSFGSGPAQFQRPSGLVWDQGLLYVVDAINHRVQVFTDQGQFQGILGPGSSTTNYAAGVQDPGLTFKLPYDISVGPSGDLYVCEYGAGRVTRFTRRGELVGRFGESGRSSGQMRTPWGLTVAPDGSVFVADTGNKRIVEWAR